MKISWNNKNQIDHFYHFYEKLFNYFVLEHRIRNTIIQYLNFIISFCRNEPNKQLGSFQWSVFEHMNRKYQNQRSRMIQKADRWNRLCSFWGNKPTSIKVKTNIRTLIKILFFLKKSIKDLVNTYLKIWQLPSIDDDFFLIDEIFISMTDCYLNR